MLAAARRVAILEDVNNHTNIGAVFRGAAALGIDAVLLSPTCADPLYRRSVRVSMGEVFAVPYARLEPWPDGLDRVRAAGFTVLALTPAAGRGADAAAGRRPAGPARPAARRRGSRAVPARAGRQRRPGAIPMRRGVDSLNVAAAAAVAFWELGRDDDHLSGVARERHEWLSGCCAVARRGPRPVGGDERRPAVREHFPEC